MTKSRRVANPDTPKPARGQPLKGATKTKRINVSINNETDAQLKKINANRSEAIRIAAKHTLIVKK
jgi:hypothetical protein